MQILLPSNPKTLKFQIKFYKILLRYIRSAIFNFRKLTKDSPQDTNFEKNRFTNASCPPFYNRHFGFYTTLDIKLFKSINPIKHLLILNQTLCQLFDYLLLFGRNGSRLTK